MNNCPKCQSTLTNHRHIMIGTRVYADAYQCARALHGEEMGISTGCGAVDMYRIRETGAVRFSTIPWRDYVEVG